MNTRFKSYLVAELTLIFLVLPAVISVLKPRGAIYYFLWICTLLCLRWLQKDKDYRFARDWNYAALTRDNLKKLLLRFLVLFPLLIVFTAFMLPDRLFSFPRERPQMWLMVMIFYPLLSVVPQEIIFRSFFFRRYQSILQGNNIYFISAFAFGWVHIILQNWIAVLLSSVGGYMFARTYGQKNSLLLACLEHALYGCCIFTIGLGFYFYHGTAVR